MHGYIKLRINQRQIYTKSRISDVGNGSVVKAKHNKVK